MFKINTQKIKYLISGAIIGSLFTSAVAFADLPIKLIVNGKEIQSDVPPQIINGRTLVPARPLAEALGAKVDWDSANRAVIVKSNNNISNTFTNNQNNAQQTAQTDKQNGIEVLHDYLKNADVPALRINGNVYIPLRAGAEKYNLQINWNNTNKTIEFPQSSMSVSLSDTVGQGDAFIYNGRTYAKESIFVKANSSKHTETVPTIQTIPQSNTNTSSQNNTQTNNQSTDDNNRKTREFIESKISAIRNEGPVGYWTDDNSYNLELHGKQNELLKNQSWLSSLMLDDSFEAKSKKTELNQNIQQLSQEIKEIQDKRTRQLRIENLEKQLDIYR